MDARDSSTFDLAHCRVAGAMVLPHVHAPFDRGAIVLKERASGVARYGRVRGYATNPDRAYVAPLTDADWAALLASGCACRFTAQPAVLNCAVWVLSDTFLLIPTDVRVLQALGTWVGFGRWERRYLVVEDATALAARDAWAREATADAETRLRRGDFDGALRAARLAFCTERSMSSDRVGTLMAAYRATGHVRTATGYLQMAENSRGREFAESARVRADSLGAKST